uniref:GLC7-interacting protein 3 n=1 Tax=Zeugodacus cucurbitae TaxID=28588 RepID=A0A0A1X6X0_ZEUCU
MTTISVSSTESTAEETECLLGDGTKTWGNTNMDTTQSKTSQKADIIRSLGNHKINKQTESQSCAGQQLLKTAVTSCWQKSMQRLTNTNKAGSPPANYCNWSYRMLRRKQLLLLLALLIFIVYLSSSMSNNDYADERIPVLHYSHVPGMKVSTNSTLYPASTLRSNKSVDAKPLQTPPTDTELPLPATPTSTPELIEASTFDQTTHTAESFNDSNSENPFTNDTYKIMRPPTGYLVWSESCRIPDVDVHAPDMMQHFKREKYKPCSNKKPLTTVVYNATSREYVLQIEESEIKSFSKSGRIHCCYQSIMRNGTGIKADVDYKLSKCVPFKKSVSLSPSIESILVQCDSNKRNVYKNGHPLINDKPKVRERLKAWKTKDTEHGRQKPPSILMIGIDSISRVNLIRAMPKTAQHLYDNDWFELSGYNKIDDNTFPNFMAVLAGYNKNNTITKCPPTVLGALDNCSLIWNTFREHGYVTGYGEDAAEISTFNYYKVGFTKPPADYYLRPFQLAAEHHLHKTYKSGLTFCLGYQQSAQFTLDYAIEFATRFKDDPLFALFWANSFSHNNLSDCSSMDVVILDYLERLTKLGILERMVVVFFSDHGLRFGPARTTASGHMEERLPFIFIWLPQYLKQKYPSFVNALSANKNRLTTPYDLHMTLKHLLSMSERVEDKSKFLTVAEGCQNCQTLLEPVPLDRSCNDAEIAEHWCTCIPYNKVYKNLNIIQKLANSTVNYINELVRNFRNGTFASQCRTLQLSSVVSAHRSYDAFRPKDANGTALDVYRLHFVTKPNSADFEVTLRYNPDTEAIHITGEISRLDSYYKDSHCILDSFVKKYCSCV